MTDQTAAWLVCWRCRAELGGLRVTITEQASTIGTSEWAFCSWECARQLVSRMDRLGRLGTTSAEATVDPSGTADG